jgi:hypothetical protein
MGKRHVAKKAAPAAAPGAAAVQPESAFERMSHRRHFDVVGRKCVRQPPRRCAAAATSSGNPMHMPQR